MTTSPSVSSPLSGPTHEFGLDFLKHLNRANPNRNVLFSPLSTHLAYGMLLEGSAGETEKQIKDVLKLSSIGDRSEVSKEIKKLLEGYKSNEKGSADRDFTLAIGNLAMVCHEAKLKEAFVRNLTDDYLASVTNEDFKNGDAVRDKVNSWVAKKTHNKITELLTSPPDPRTFLLLVNTLYFKGKWEQIFPKTATYVDTFNNADGSKSKVQMMCLRNKSFKYMHNEETKVKAVELPYHGNVSMLFIMPTESNTLAGFLSSLNSTDLNNLIGSLRSIKLATVGIPKFKLEDEHQLDQILPEMGMDLPFGLSANLTNIADYPDLQVSKSIQKALLEVDEEGSVAVAATFITMMAKSLVINPEDFIADRPFVFMIRDMQTGINLFMGQMSQMVNNE